MVSKSRRKTVTEEKVVESWEECDRCGKRVDSPAYHNFECQEGDHYPEGGSGIALDLCGECRKLFWKLLKDNGFEPHEYDW